MAINDAFLAEFEQEVDATRRLLGRVPEDRLGWRPHEKSMTVGQLALHVAGTPGQVAQLAVEDRTPAPEFGAPAPQPASLAEVMSALDASVETLRRLLPTFDDAAMSREWSAHKDGRPIVAMPRAALLRSIMLNHWYHHRGQLSVYVRLLGQSVPSVYGPSADERPEWMPSEAQPA